MMKEHGATPFVYILLWKITVSLPQEECYFQINVQQLSKECSVIITTSFYDMNQKISTKKAYFQNFI